MFISGGPLPPAGLFPPGSSVEKLSSLLRHYDSSVKAGPPAGKRLTCRNRYVFIRRMYARESNTATLALRKEGSTTLRAPGLHWNLLLLASLLALLLGKGAGAG